MARDRANVFTDIWADTDWRQLSESAQRLYLLLLTHDTLNYAGVADWRPKRLVPLSRSTTIESLSESAEELESKGFIVIDEDTDEVLVRSFVKHDGLMKSPNLAAAMASAYGGTASRKIREVIAFEAQKLHAREPELKGWGKAKTILSEPSRDVFDQPFEKPSLEPFGKGLTEPFEKPSRTATATTTSSKEDRRGSRRAPETPMPDDWKPTESHIAKAKEENLDIKHEADVFASDALAKDKRFRNWNMAFNTWLARANNFKPQSMQTSKQTDLWNREGPF